MSLECAGEWVDPMGAGIVHIGLMNCDILPEKVKFLKIFEEFYEKKFNFNFKRCENVLN